MGQPWPILHVVSFFFRLELARFILVLGRCRSVSFFYRVGAGPFLVGLVSAHFHVRLVLAHFVVCWVVAGPSFFMLGRAGPFQINTP